MAHSHDAKALVTPSVAPSTTPAMKIGGSLVGIMDAKRKTIVFGHHPCPDGIAALVCLAERLGKENAYYYGLNHAKLEDMEKNIFSTIGSQSANVIFADIIPPFKILKKLLETTACTVTLLDHHETAKKQIEENINFLNTFIQSTPQRLDVKLDLTRSGVGISFDYATGKKQLPVYLSLVQAIDMLTATANTDVIKQFDKEQIKIDSQSQTLLSSLGELSQNNQIKSYIEFYVFAAVFDLKMKMLFKQSNNKMDDALMASVKTFFDLMEKNGLSSLLKSTVSDSKETSKSVELMFREQLAYQKDAIANATVIPSMIYGAKSDDAKIDVLFIEADMQTGRTFDPLIEQKLAGLTRPAIAMVVNTKNISDNNNWVSLRAANRTFDLCAIAEMNKTKNLAANGGGHARASALQLSRSQLSYFLEMSNKVKQQQQQKPSAGLSDFGVFSSSSHTAATHSVGAPPVPKK